MARGVKKGSKTWYRYYVWVQDNLVFFQQRDGEPIPAAMLQLCTVKSNVCRVALAFSARPGPCSFETGLRIGGRHETRVRACELACLSFGLGYASWVAMTCVRS